MTAIGKPILGRLTGRRIASGLAIGIAPATLSAAVPGAAAGRVAPSSSLDGVVRQLLNGKFASDPGIRFGDGSFYLPTLDEVRHILEASKLDRQTWTEERFDCDDFAYVLKGEMSQHAYQAQDLRFGLCVGIVWGNFDWVQGYHAVNWLIDSTQTLSFIEPQDDTIYDLTHCQGGISLLLT